MVAKGQNCGSRCNIIYEWSLNKYVDFFLVFYLTMSEDGGKDVKSSSQTNQRDENVSL